MLLVATDVRNKMSFGLPTFAAVLPAAAVRTWTAVLPLTKRHFVSDFVLCMYESKFSTAGHTDCVQLLEQWGMSHKGGTLPSTEMSMAETFVSMFMDNLSQVSCDS